MYLLRFASSPAAFVLAFAAAAFPQQPPAPAPVPAPAAPAAAPAKKVEFANALTPGEARLVEIRTVSVSTIRIQAGDQGTDSKSREESTTFLVDTLLDPAGLPKDRIWSGRRRFVKTQATKDGVVTDPEVTGLDADVWVDTASKIHFSCRDERMVSPAKMDALLREACLFGVAAGVPLPASAAVGDEFDLPFGALAPWCLGTEGATPKANAHLRFDEVDAKKNVARLKGTLHVEEIVEKSAEQLDAPFGIKGTGTYDGSVSIEYDVAARRVARIVCRARAVLEGETVGSVAAKASGTNVIETTITCLTGAPAASALNEKPRFRDVPRDVAAAGVSIDLPSHFFKYASKIPNTATYRSDLVGEKAYVRVLVMPIEEAGKKSVKEVGDNFRAGFSEKIGKGTIVDAKVSWGLGNTNAFEFTRDGERGVCAVAMLGPSRFVVVQCACPEAAWAERSKEFPKYFQSLKKLPAR